MVKMAAMDQTLDQNGSRKSNNNVKATMTAKTMERSRTNATNVTLAALIQVLSINI